MLACKCLAWLDTVPDKSTSPRRELSGDKFHDTPKSPYLYLIETLSALGTAKSDSMGISPITHQDIYYFRLNTGIDLTPNECELLTKMSDAYVAQYRDKSPDCPYPYITKKSIEANRSRIAAILTRKS